MLLLDEDKLRTDPLTVIQVKENLSLLGRYGTFIDVLYTKEL